MIGASVFGLFSLLAGGLILGIAVLSGGAVALLLALDLGTDSGFGSPLIIG